MFEISKEFRFEAAHLIVGLPRGHKCGRLHGHSYRVTVVLRAEDTNKLGFVRDFGELDAFKRFIDENLDHRYLNDELHFNPTSENLALHLFQHAKALYPETCRVIVAETCTTQAVYERQD